MAELVNAAAVNVRHRLLRESGMMSWASLYGDFLDFRKNFTAIVFSVFLEHSFFERIPH